MIRRDRNSTLTHHHDLKTEVSQAAAQCNTSFLLQLSKQPRKSKHNTVNWVLVILFQKITSPHMGCPGAIHASIQQKHAPAKFNPGISSCVNLPTQIAKSSPSTWFSAASPPSTGTAWVLDEARGTELSAALTSMTSSLELLGLPARIMWSKHLDGHHP